MTAVFDFHVRLAPDLLSTMDTHSITRAGVAAGGVVDLDRLSRQLSEGGHVESDADNAAVLDACARSSGRLVPFYFANPHNLAPYRHDAHRFRGLELSPAVHGVGFDDPRTTGLVDIAADAGHPVYTVCTGRPGARAADLVALACRYPAVPFVFGHCGASGIDLHGINRIAPVPNILAETSGCFSVAARAALDRLGPDRVLFATEYPLQDPGVEFAKYAALRLDPADWAKVAWRNAHRLLREEYP
jgi:predicted TIM-barrel fold metal-dependent hydrolase